METNMTKKKDGWTAKTIIPMGDDRELHIETSKSSAGFLIGLVTRASVHKRDGMFLVHAFGLGTGRGDFSQRMETTEARVTEKSVSEQHARNLEQADMVLTLAREHYARQAALAAQEVAA
jgi:hypothetical protein